jgi:hypothetical protein
MFFKGIEVQLGDFIIFTSPTVPLPEVQAEVIDVTEGVLKVGCVFLGLFRHDGHFTEEEVEQLVVVKSFEETISMES